MIETWYGVVAFMLIVYIVLDGRNFGAGMLHWLVARTPEERRQVMAAIGPLWSWHEVWLVGFGGTLIGIFPRLMAAAFSGYYLALFLILWSLILRGIAIEVSGHIDDRLWQGFWDFVFVVSSFLLAALFGVAGGNLARGVPLDAHGNFCMAFFSDFRPEGNVGLIDWYTLSITLFATVMMAAHGATYLTLKTEGPVRDRSALFAKWLWTAIIPLLLLIAVQTWIIRADLCERGLRNPVCWLGAVLIAVSAYGLLWGIRNRREICAFLGSNFLIAGMLATGAAALFPVMLYSTLAPENSLTVYAVASSPAGLHLASIWWPAAFIMAVSYFIFISREYRGKVSVKRDTQGFY